MMPFLFALEAGEGLLYYYSKLCFVFYLYELYLL